MAVYTRLSKQDICSLLALYDLGELENYKGIAGGVENTNYFLDIRTNNTVQRYVLTLFEYLPENSLPFFIDYTDELKAEGLPVPAAIRDRAGNALHKVMNKPALIVPCFPGHQPDSISVKHCEQLGSLLGKIHKTGLSSSLKQPNQRGITWLNNQQKRLSNLLPRDDAEYMKDQWQQITAELAEHTQLPKGLIHGDLFHDNTLFSNDQLTGVIDFYQASYDYLLYDLAVTVNDWCIRDDLELDQEKTTLLLTNYAAIRPFTLAEKKAWQLMLKLAAFRFWVSRIITFVHPEKPFDSAHKTTLEQSFLDPDKFKFMLEKRNKQVKIALP